MVNLQEIRDRLKELQKSPEHRKQRILGKLIDFCYELEKIKNIHLYKSLQTDIKWLKELIESYESDTDSILPVDLEIVNETYRHYKHLIKKL